MDVSTLILGGILLILALAVGAALGVWWIRRQTPVESIEAVTIANTTDAALLQMSNLIIYLGEQSETRTLLRHAADWLCKEGDAQFVVIYPYNAAAHELSEPITAGREAPLLTPRYRMGAGIFGEVASTRKSHFVDYVSRDVRFGPTAPGMEFAYVVPLVSGTTLLGVLSAQSERAGAFPISQRRILDRFAAVIALQALITQKVTESRQAIARFGTFQDLALQLVERLDSKKLLQPIVEAAREMLDTQMSILLEVREDDTRLYAVAWSGISEETALSLESRFKEDLKGLVAWARKPARTPDLRTDQRTARATQAVVAGMISELAVPVMYGDKLYGTLAVETDEYRNFTDEEMNLLMALAAQAGIALRNAQLFETVQETNQKLEVAFSALQASQVEIERAHAAEIAAYEAELETARAIQTSLLPQEKPPVPQVQLAARNIPARHVSGDFYQYLLLPDGKLGVAVGDVSGKGMPAALLMAVTTTTLRDEIVRTPSAAGVLNGLNERLLARMKQTNMNSALTMAIFDPATSTVEVANAGMVQPYVRSNANWDPVAVGGYPLGASGRSNYSAKTCALPPGATMLFISDGVIESQDATSQFYGFERFESLLATLPMNASPEQIVDTILSAVYQHLENQEPQDDITVVVLQATPELVPVPATL